MSEKYPNFKVYYTLDKPDEDWQGFSGFVTTEMLEKSMPKKDKDTLIIACGPPRMMDLIKNLVKEMGFD